MAVSPYTHFSLLLSLFLSFFLLLLSLSLSCVTDLKAATCARAFKKTSIPLFSLCSFSVSLSLFQPAHFPSPLYKMSIPLCTYFVHTLICPYLLLLSELLSSTACTHKQYEFVLMYELVHIHEHKLI